MHRAETVDDARRLRIVLGALGRLSRDIPVVLPLHPRTAKALPNLGLRKTPGLRIVPPVGYLDTVMLEKHARVIATDSGGVQKEAFLYRVPCATLRAETEWAELVESGWNRLVRPTSEAEVLRCLRECWKARNGRVEDRAFTGTAGPGRRSRRR